MNLLQTEDPRKTARIVAIILISVLMLSSSFVVFVAPVLAHGPTYCGTTQRWVTSDGKLYLQDFVRYYDNGDHRWRSHRYIHNQLGYVPYGDWHYHRSAC